MSIFLGGAAIYLHFNKPTVDCGLAPDDGISSGPAETTRSEEEISIPTENQWIDFGPILEAGSKGSWDFGWTGMSSIVKKKGTYYFYYIAHDGNRSHDGEAARHRAIGVATSRDGVRFTKYSKNPIMTYSPFHGEEEGANSAGVTLNSNGDFVMYYGAAMGPRAEIHADGRSAISQDGYSFKDMGMVLNHEPPYARFLPAPFQRAGVYKAADRVLPGLLRGRAPHGYGDEIFPVATFHQRGSWYVYYIPNGGTATRTLGVAWGASFNKLPCSVKVLDGNWEKPVWLWGNVIRLSPEKIALFVQRLWRPDTVIEVRTASRRTPQKLSEPIERYHIPHLAHGAVFLDRDRKTWFMYYNTFDRFWRVKLAPAGSADATPPTAPRNLSVKAVAPDAVTLSWSPAMDRDTGIAVYRIYRDGVKLGRTTGLTFTDSLPINSMRYRYAVAAVNLHGVQGPKTKSSITMAAAPSRARIP